MTICEFGPTEFFTIKCSESPQRVVGSWIGRVLRVPNPLSDFRITLSGPPNGPCFHRPDLNSQSVDDTPIRKPFLCYRWPQIWVCPTNRTPSVAISDSDLDRDPPPVWPSGGRIAEQAVLCNLSARIVISAVQNSIPPRKDTGHHTSILTADLDRLVRELWLRWSCEFMSGVGFMSLERSYEFRKEL